MADVGGTIGEITGGLFSGTLGIMVIIILFLVGFGIAGGIFMWVKYRKKFDIRAKIISRRAGENKVYFDKGAILTDRKTKQAYFKLYKSGIEIELPPFNIFYNTNEGDYVELLRKSDRDICFLTPPRIDKEYIIKKDGKKFPIVELQQREIENDIAWIIDRQSQNKKIIDPESLIMKLLAYAPQIISAVISMMILWMVFRYAPDLLSAMESYAETIKEGNKPETVEVIGSMIPLLIGGHLWKKKI